jgi:hypothetical protein
MYYPIAYLWSEARIVHQRLAERDKSDALILQSAIMTIFSDDARKSFKQLVEDLGSGY